MWVFTPHGFYSVVERQGAEGQVMIRSRSKAHLLRLVRLGYLPKGTRIEETPRNDYRFRVTVHRDLWAEIAWRLAQDVDYGNFKGAVERGAYLTALHDVWFTMKRAFGGRGMV